MAKHRIVAAPSRRHVIKAAAALTAGTAAPAILGIRTALAYPDRAVKIVVPNSPGGPSDLIARQIAIALQQALGGSFVVENKGGGGGNIGMANVARSAPDGYTLLLSTSVFAVNPNLYNNVPYDPLKDFAAVAELATTPNVLAVKPELGVKTMRELVALARANQEKFNISTPPIGTTPHLATELLKLREGLPKVATVVFAGGGDALKALLSDTVQLSVGGLAPAHPHLKAATINGLSVTGAARWHDLPDVPTMAEAGFNNFVFENYTALLAPAKTPAEIVSRLERETLAFLNRPETRNRLLQSGFEVQAKDGKTHLARVAREVAMYGEIIAQAGIKKL